MSATKPALYVWISVYTACFAVVRTASYPLGRVLRGIIHDHDIVNINDGSQPFLKNTSTNSCLDLAFVSREVASTTSWNTARDGRRQSSCANFNSHIWFCRLPRRPKVRKLDWKLYREATGRVMTVATSDEQLPGTYRLQAATHPVLPRSRYAGIVKN